MRDFQKYKYSYMVVNVDNKDVSVQAWDACEDKDYPHDAWKNCCTKNSKKF